MAVSSGRTVVKKLYRALRKVLTNFLATNELGIGEGPRNTLYPQRGGRIYSGQELRGTFRGKEFIPP